MQLKAYCKACSVQAMLLMTAPDTGPQPSRISSNPFKKTLLRLQQCIAGRQAPVSSQTWLIMKLTFFLLTAVLMNVHARGFSQEVTFTGRDVPLQKVFSAIESQTGYVFFYNSRLLRQAKPVTLDVQKKPLAEVLKACMQGQPLDFAIENTTIVITKRTFSGPANTEEDRIPPVKISGTITDGKKQPLANATVTVKESGQKTLTDNNGYFEIIARTGNTLVISYVGYEAKSVKINGSGPVNITLLPSVTVMQEIAVTASTGYQTISKERATGAYDVVGRDVLNKRPVSNLSTALQGLVPGMQGKEKSDGSFNFLVRGTGSLYADSKPLVVVDGFPVSDTSFFTVNPNDVESVTVLKDAAAASIWGARSANGVIVITTKQARASRLQVDFNVFTRISDNINLNQVLNQADSPDFIKYERLAWQNNWMLGKYNGAFTGIRTSLTLAQELLYANETGKITTDAMNKGLDSLTRISNRGQVGDLLLRRPVLNQYNLSISGGSERLKSYASLLYEKNKDGYIKNGYNRYMLSFRNQYRAAKFINFFVGATLQYTKQETSGPTINEIQQLSPYETLLNPDGSYGVNFYNINREQLATLPLGKLPYADWSYNLLREVRGRTFTNEDLSARVQAGVTVNIIKGLTFDSKVQYEKRKTDLRKYYSEDAFFVRDMVNYNIDYNNTTKTVNQVYVPKGGIETPGVIGNTNYSNVTTESYVFRNQLNFDRTFGTKHAVVAIAGTEVSQYETNSKANPWLYGYYPDKLQATVPPYGYGSTGNTFKNLIGSTGVTLQGGNTVLGWEQNRYLSFYGNASYTYNRKYTFSGSVRSDASNYITDDPSLRWSPFWSVGGMWNIQREDFMNKISFVDALSLRATYGRNGNAEKSTSTKTLLNVGSSVNTTTGTITATISDYGNPLLRWEKTTTTNIGVDFSLFKHKLTGKIDYYNKLGSDIVGLVSLPSATGTTAQKFNNAKIANKGIEVSLGTDLKIPGTPVWYATSLTYAYNWNRITDLYYPSIYGFDMLGGGFVQGRPVGSVYSYTYLGMTSGEPYVAGVKGVPNRFDDLALHNRGLGLQYLNYEGTSVPPHTLGWYNSLKAFNFSVNVLFTGTLGGVYRNPIFNYATLIGSGKTNVDRYVADVFAGNPDIPSFPQANDPGTYRWDRYGPNLNGLIASSSYIECKEITIDYTLPAKMASAIQTSGIRLYVQSRNPGMVYHANDKGFNPDWLPGSNKPLRTYTMGLNVQF